MDIYPLIIPCVFCMVLFFPAFVMEEAQRLNEKRKNRKAYAFLKKQRRVYR